MKRVLIALGASFAMIAAAQASSDSAVVYSIMKDMIAPQADRLWEISGRATNDDGEPDGNPLSAQDWDALAATAGEMKAASMNLATAQDIIVAPAGVQISGEEAPGTPTAAQVQQFIANDRPAFVGHAQQLGDISEAFIQAAATRDAVKLQDASERMSTACEGCHAQFWYPEQ